jgi:hypothetical protein
MRCSAPLKHERLYTPWQPAAGHCSPQQNHNRSTLHVSRLSHLLSSATHDHLPQILNLTSALTQMFLTQTKSVRTRIPHISLYSARASLDLFQLQVEVPDHNEMYACTALRQTGTCGE